MLNGFTSSNHIYSRDSSKEEPGKFNSFNLFDTDIIINGHHLQDKFSEAQKRSLQCGIKSEYKQYLNKTATLAKWGCGVGLSLNTYIPEQVVGPERAYCIQEEQKYRSILKEYAINNVLAVTKLIYRTNLLNLFTPPPTVEYEEISDDEE